MVAPSSVSVRKERQRCINIVSEYRGELVRAYSEKPHASNAAQVLRLINRLDEMINKMAGVVGDNKHEIHVGGFSMEEMAKAEEIIAQQDRNPFED